VAQQGQPAESRILLIQTATGESLVPDSRATGSNRYAFGFLDWDFDRWTSNRPNEERVLALTH
jgi:hypothetical protein